MAESPHDDALKLPGWLVRLCKWFWGQRSLVWGAIILNIILGAIVTWAFTDPSTIAKLPIGFVFQHPFVVLLVFVVILSVTLISGLVSRLAVTSPTVGAGSVRNLEQRYLKRVVLDTELLTLRGIPAGLISESVRLDDVFIPIQLRPNRPRIDYPLSEKELEQYRQFVKRGVFARDLDRVVLDAEKNWQYILKQTDRISIADMWERLDADHPAAVIQGYPGMGKSTLMERLALHMARCGLRQNDPNMPEPERFKTPLVPVLLRLGRYAGAREKSPGLSLDDYLLLVLDELHIEGIEGVIQSALARGTPTHMSVDTYCKYPLR